MKFFSAYQSTNKIIYETYKLKSSSIIWFILFLNASKAVFRFFAPNLSATTVANLRSLLKNAITCHTEYLIMVTSTI